MSTAGMDEVARLPHEARPYATSSSSRDGTGTATIEPAADGLLHAEPTGMHETTSLRRPRGGMRGGAMWSMAFVLLVRLSVVFAVEGRSGTLVVIHRLVLLP
jgi:hypothetical protein